MKLEQWLFQRLWEDIKGNIMALLSIFTMVKLISLG